MEHGSTRRQEALRLSEELLDDIDLSRLAPLDIARKTFRLARLLDDARAIAWLDFEANGYDRDREGHLSRAAVDAAERSGRRAERKDDKWLYWTMPLGQMHVEVEAALSQAAALSSAPASSSEWAAVVENNKASERASLTATAAKRRELIDRVVGSLHRYVVERNQELRFGAAVETAFEVVRATVDSEIQRLVPDAVTMLAGAFSNATSDNPEHWANAASTCRRLLQEAADVLQPPGDDHQTQEGKTIKMGEPNYINRLVRWIQDQADSETTAGMIAADLEYLGRRLDASDDAGHKGAHSHVTRFEASRYITGTYLVLGDILDLASPNREIVEGESPGAA